MLKLSCIIYKFNLSGFLITLFDLLNTTVSSFPFFSASSISVGSNDSFIFSSRSFHLVPVSSLLVLQPSLLQFVVSVNIFLALLFSNCSASLSLHPNYSIFSSDQHETFWDSHFLQILLGMLLYSIFFKFLHASKTLYSPY